jgi:predicted NBD/HSP70 family sugar kinase
MEHRATGDVRGTVQLRVLNTRRVLAALRAVGEPVRISDLVGLTSLARPTVAQIVEGLEGCGHLRKYAPAAAAGRPAARFGLTHDAVAVFGADAGAYRAVVEVVTLDGRRRARREQRDTPPLGQAMLTLLGGMVRECLGELSLGTSSVLAGTVGSPGIVDHVTGGITLRPGMGTWEIRQVRSVLGDLVGGEVAVENDANLAARAMCDVAGVPSTFLGLQWGQRLGAGVVLDGRVYRGPAGAAGELGSLLVTDPSTDEVVYLEDVVRASRLPQLGGAPHLSTEELLVGAANGDADAVEALGRGVDPLAAAIAPVCLALDLRAVTVSGAIARSGPALATALREALARHGTVDVECHLSPFHEDTVLRGAVQSAVDAGWNAFINQGELSSAAPLIH